MAQDKAFELSGQKNLDSRGLAAKRSQPLAVFWFRRDLRLEDNVGLAAALKSGLKSGLPVLPLFIFDRKILSRLKSRKDARVEFILATVHALGDRLRELGSDLLIKTGDPEDVWREILAEFEVKKIFLNQDYEPYAVERDDAIARLAKGIEFRSFKDQVIFEKLEVQKGTGGPYSVFTPYMKKWLSQLTDSHLTVHKADAQKFLPVVKPFTRPSLEDLGFAPSGLELPPAVFERQIIKHYAERRDFPALAGTTRLGLHFRFGTLSVREAVKEARKLSPVWLSELIWREFFMQILWNYPHVVGAPFRSEYAAIRWRDDEKAFAKWREGQTGYPIVDAGMRELNETGFMHNRVRMIAGSFLVKHLLIDWRRGEEVFADRLLDFELASNNGNWQWVAGCGCDAAPYFRVFNPETQAKKFDADGRYTRRWVPELGTAAYPEPIVEHAAARARALDVYKAGLVKARGRGLNGGAG